MLYWLLILFQWHSGVHYCRVWNVYLKCDSLEVKGDRGALTRMRPRGFVWSSKMWGAGLIFYLCVISFAGKFREKASILHKIAKKKCQVEDSEKANGVASRSGDDFKLTLMLCGRIVYSFLIELARLIKSRVYKAKSKYKLISFMEFQCSCPGVCNLWFLSHLLLAMIISVSFF